MAMHIHILHTVYPHWGERSGIRRMIAYLDPGRYRVTLRPVSDNDDDFPLRSERVRNLVRRIIPNGNMQWYKLSDLAAEAAAMAKCLRDPPDLIHFFDGEHSARFLPLLLRRLPRRRPRIVATYHQPAALLPLLTDMAVLERLDHITVVSPCQAPFFSRFVPADRISVILYGVDTEFFTPGKEVSAKTEFRCITVGHYLRDFDLLREICLALSPYRDIVFEVVSSQPTGLADLPNVRTYRGVPDSALLDLYRNADLLLLPLVHATANNALLEAMACGIPAVVSSLPSVEAYTMGKGAIQVRDNTVKGFVDAILGLRADPVLRGRLAAAARSRAEELDWRRIAPRYEALYDDLLNGGGAR